MHEREAEEIKWVYCRDNKVQLISSIKECRTSILAKLMDGMAVEKVFMPLAQPAEPAKRMRRAA